MEKGDIIINKDPYMGEKPEIINKITIEGVETLFTNPFDGNGSFLLTDELNAFQVIGNIN